MAMKMVLAIFHEVYGDRVRDVLEGLGVPGYTQFRGLSGRGATGLRYDTAVWPGRNAALLTVVDDAVATRVVKELRTFKEALGTRTGRPGGIEAFVLPVEAAV
jgi:nitrogen regulatory protein PII